MKLAVLLPAYNPGEELAATLESLRAQNVPFKLFVVDDGSARKPDYAALLGSFDHQLFALPRNVGVMLVRNAALEAILAQGFDAIALIDCGDRALPGRFQCQAEYLAAHPDVAIVGSHVEMIYEDGQRFVAEFPTGEASVRRMMWSNMPVCHPALMIRADVFRAIGLYSAEYDAAEDYDMIRRAAAHGFAIDNVQHVLLQKYETRNSVSWKRRREQLASRLKIQWHYRQLRDPGCLAGLLKTLLLRTMPDTLIRRLKAAIG